MFAVRGIVISLAVFAVVYCAMSAGVLLTWRKLWVSGGRQSASERAEGLFFLRIVPFICAIFVAVGLAAPSFLIFEPRSIHEQLGAMTIALAIAGLAFVLFGLGRAIAALGRASRMIHSWTRNAQKFESESSVFMLHGTEGGPAMTAAGILRQKILLSRGAASLLTAGELRAALKHEYAHLRRRDNFRKLCVQFAPFPGTRHLEAAWLEAAEMAADDSAVENAGEALDLASALIKLSRVVSLTPPPELTAALIHSPASLTEARVKRLVAWKEHSSDSGRSAIVPGLSAGAVALSLFVSYGHLLVHVHAATEWLVR
jgi:beta-lactamase regulating signal transducer with metallopeptidase domain